jgi:hypothetical protein
MSNEDDVADQNRTIKIKGKKEKHQAIQGKGGKW